MRFYCVKLYHGAQLIRQRYRESRHGDHCWLTVVVQTGVPCWYGGQCRGWPLAVDERFWSLVMQVQTCEGIFCFSSSVVLCHQSWRYRHRSRESPSQCQNDPTDAGCYQSGFGRSICLQVWGARGFWLSGFAPQQSDGNVNEEPPPSGSRRSARVDECCRCWTFRDGWQMQRCLWGGAQKRFRRERCCSWDLVCCEVASLPSETGRCQGFLRGLCLSEVISWQFWRRLRHGRWIWDCTQRTVDDGLPTGQNPQEWRRIVGCSRRRTIGSLEERECNANVQTGWWRW